MRNKILATMLLFASFSFAQFDTEESNAFTDNNSVYTDNASNSTNGDNPYYTTTSTNNGNQSYTKTYTSSNNQYYSTNPESKDPYMHAHRGFFFSPSITFGRTYFRHSYTSSSYYSDSYKETYKYKGYQVPQAEIRLGGTIASAVTVYGCIGLGVGTGTFNYKKKLTDSYDNSEDKNYDATNIRFAFGAGLEFYPVQDKESASYGLFLGVAGGFAIEGAFYDEEVRYSSYYGGYYDETESESEAVPGLFLRFEFGKDWWFARRWSFGVSFNYTIGGFGVDDNDSSYHSDKDDYVSHLFGFTIRLAH